MPEKILEHILPNGMVVLGEQMAAVQSVAFCFMLPAGVARMPDGCCGASNVIEDWIFRGAGEADSRQLSDALDSLGLHRASSVGPSYLTVAGTLESGNLSQALDIYGDVILKSRLKDEQFELARKLAIEGVLALDDDPRQKVMLLVRERFYPWPLGRSTVGKVEELETLTAEKVRDMVGSNFNLSKSIFAVAGKFDFDAVCKQMERLFGHCRPQPLAGLDVKSQAAGYHHLPNDGAQVHIGLMVPTVKLSDADYYNARLAVAVLSGGMSSRLFTEVREKRGLCYAVGARYHGLKEAAGIVYYAGTVPESAQQTVEVIVAESARLAEGISEEELTWAKTGLKSDLIMNSESTSSRAGGIAGDYHLLGRVRSLDEIKQNIEQTSVDSVVGFLRQNRLEDFTVVTIGPKEIEMK